MHRLGSFKKQQGEQAQLTLEPEHPGRQDTGKDSGHWAGEPIGDDDSDVELREDEPEGIDGVKDEQPNSASSLDTENQSASVEFAGKADTERSGCVPSDDSKRLNGPPTSLTHDEEDAVNMPGSFHVHRHPDQNNEGLLGALIARLRGMRFSV